jgi:hypothetical protein
MCVIARLRKGAVLLGNYIRLAKRNSRKPQPVCIGLRILPSAAGSEPVYYIQYDQPQAVIGDAGGDGDTAWSYIEGPAQTHCKVLNRYSVTSCSGLVGVTSAEVKLG